MWKEFRWENRGGNSGGNRGGNRGGKPNRGRCGMGSKKI